MIGKPGGTARRGLEDWRHEHEELDRSLVHVETLVGEPIVGHGRLSSRRRIGWVVGGRLVFERERERERVCERVVGIPEWAGCH